MTSTKKQNVRVFIGTSSEQKNSIPVLQGYLETAGFETLPWTEAFKFGEYTLEALFKAVGQTNAAIFLMSLDDQRWYRGKKDDMPRDNLIFEAGLWMSRYGRKHVLILVAASADQKLGLPTDLSGLTFSMVKLGKGRDIVPVLKRERKQ